MENTRSYPVTTAGKNPQKKNRAKCYEGNTFGGKTLRIAQEHVKQKQSLRVPRAPERRAEKKRNERIFKISRTRRNKKRG